MRAGLDQSSSGPVLSLRRSIRSRTPRVFDQEVEVAALRIKGIGGSGAEEFQARNAEHLAERDQFVVVLSDERIQLSRLRDQSPRV
jgi:hypothetical protein